MNAQEGAVHHRATKRGRGDSRSRGVAQETSRGTSRSRTIDKRYHAGLARRQRTRRRFLESDTTRHRDTAHIDSIRPSIHKQGRAPLREARGHLPEG